MSYRMLGKLSESALQAHKPALLRSFLSRGEEADIDPQWLLVSEGGRA